MKFRKKDLNFLNVFNSVANNKTENGDKLKIEVKDKVAHFSLLTKDEIVIKTLENIIFVENFTIIVPIIEFWQLINSFDDDDLIVLNANVITVNNAKYSFVTYDLELEDILTYLRILNEVEVKEIKIYEVDLLRSIKDFAKGLSNDSIYTLRGCFVGMDSAIAAYYKTNNDMPDHIYFNRSIINIFNQLDIHELTLKTFSYNGRSFFYFNIDDINIFSFLKDYTFVDIFLDAFIDQYDHPTKVVVNKNNVLRVIKRMKIISQRNPSSRIFMLFEKDGLCFETRDANESRETIEAEVDPRLIGSFVIASSIDLFTILSKIQSDNVYIHASPDKQKVAIKISDKNGNNNFIHTLYKNRDEEAENSVNVGSTNSVGA